MKKITYTKTDWENGVTPLNALNMNHIENGVEMVTEAMNNFEASPIYLHHIGFRIQTTSTNLLYISLDVYSSDSTAITLSTLYKYIQKSNYPNIGGTVINVYDEAISHPEGYGLGRMCYDLDETGKVIYLFSARGGNREIEGTSLEIKISDFVDTVRKI